ncbi:hypothetical protein ACTFPA_26140 [Bacillus cereus group sp. MYBK59-1]|uniref:hypothetical protein n=1 Tax=Bacillus cereus group sp. MYBK59-1 TaxID=3450617 RepID=UPI002A398028|nr:hypothetical protein [Bacillus cereus]MDA2135450.1 hypothetical protein [Bacillus cereus]
MKLIKSLLCCGLVSVSTLGIFGVNVYAEEVGRSNTAINIVEQQKHRYKNLIIIKKSEYSDVGENRDSFMYNGSGDIEISLENKGNNTIGYTVKGPNDELILGGHVKQKEQIITTTCSNTAISALPKGVYQIYISNEPNTKGVFQLAVNNVNGHTCK